MNQILLVGSGKMGGALLDGWLDRGVAGADICVVEPDAAARARFEGRVGVAADADGIAADFSPAVVVFAVKPQVMDAIAPVYRHYRAAAFLSIAAGRTIAGFQQHLGTDAAIIRAMPNTPAAVRRGITVACASAAVSAPQRALCDDLLGAVGEVAWVDDEALLDAVTAVSGSGPAYVFLLAETLAEAGRQVGLPAALADRLARATVSGAGELLRQSAEPAAVLRRNVTSPGGTTAAALAVLMGEAGLPALMRAAVEAATRRSRELAG